MHVDLSLSPRPRTGFKLNALSATEPTRPELETRVTLPRLQRLDTDGSAQSIVHIPHPESFDSRSEHVVILATPFGVAFKGF